MYDTEFVPNRFFVEVQADASGKWAGNAVRYNMFEEAKDAGIDLANRWMLVTAVQVVELQPESDTERMCETLVWGTEK